jgi:hypothetical protein
MNRVFAHLSTAAVTRHHAAGKMMTIEHQTNVW